jgi:hypothetical protein
VSRRDKEGLRVVGRISNFGGGELEVVNQGVGATLLFFSFLKKISA